MDKNTFAAIAALEHDWAEAWLAGNTTICEFLLGEDYVEIGEDGIVISRGEWLECVEAGAPHQIRWTELRVRPFGRFAIVHGRLQLAFNASGNEQKLTCLVTDVWAFRGPEWRVVSRQLTRTHTA